MKRLMHHLPWVVVVLLVLGSTMWMRSRPEQVELVQVASEEMAELLTLSGQVHGRTESRIAPEISGTVEEIAVREGERVKAGQTLAHLNRERLRAEYDQAAEQVKVARAQLEVARRGPLPSQVEEVRAEVARSKAVAEANLESARQRLAQARRGPRVEQIRQAEAELDQATAVTGQRRRDLERQQELFRKGAVSEQSFETARTAFQQAEATQDQARQRLAELRNGTRPEELEQARQQVMEAEAELEGARQSGEARIQQLLDQPRPEDVALAQAQLDQATAALEVAGEQLELATLTAPYDGVVGRKLLEEGDLAGPSAPIFTLASTPHLEVRVEVDESELSRVEKGQKATVRATGFTEPFEAEVREFAGEVDSVKGTIETRLWPTEAPEWLVPGQTVDVNIILSPQTARLLVPLTSVTLKGDSAYVLTVVGDRIAEREITVSTPSQDGYLVKSGLEAGDWVVRYPQGVEVGQQVRTSRSNWR